MFPCYVSQVKYGQRRHLVRIPDKRKDCDQSEEESSKEWRQQQQQKYQRRGMCVVAIALCSTACDGEWKGGQNNINNDDDNKRKLRSCCERRRRRRRRDDDGQGLVPIHDSYNKRSSITEKKSVYTTVPMIAAALLCVDVTA